jgi:hypothetical protein
MSVSSSTAVKGKARVELERTRTVAEGELHRRVEGRHLDLGDLPAQEPAGTRA